MTSVIRPVSPQAIADGVALLKAGQLVGFPTETVYGLGADASDAEAVARIFAAKGRPNDHPVIVHVAPGADLSRWAARLSPDAELLIAAYWPGPLTLIVSRAAGVLDAVTGGQDTVGLRCPSHPVAQQLLRAFGGGVAAPSANRFGRVSPTTAQHVADEFGSALSLVIDGGPCEVGIESTIIDLSGNEPVLLRPGHISVEALSRTLDRPVLTREEVEARRATPRVSGALAAHYAPRTALELVAAKDIGHRVQTLMAAGLRVGVWSAAQPVADVSWVAAPTDPVAYAQDLYATLRLLDAQGLDILLLEATPDNDAWSAVNDRLGRAVVGSGSAS